MNPKLPTPAFNFQTLQNIALRSSPTSSHDYSRASTPESCRASIPQEIWCEDEVTPPRMPALAVSRPIPQPGEATKEMTGVVIWHEDLAKPLDEIRKQQRDYGNHLSGEITRIAESLRGAEPPSLSSLWAEARVARCSAALFISSDFMMSRHPAYERAISGTFYTPLKDRYEYLKNRVALHPTYQAETQTLSINGRLVDAEGHARDVPLTSFHLTPLVDSAHFRSLGMVEAFPRIRHTDPETLPPVLHHAEQLYRTALSEPDDGRFREQAAKLYWWLAHATPDLRGSAAKTEICFRALHAARGLECPLWKPGVSPDLEAMLRTEEQWLKEYPSLQWPSAEEDLKSGGPGSQFAAIQAPPQNPQAS